MGVRASPRAWRVYFLCNSTDTDLGRPRTTSDDFRLRVCTGGGLLLLLLTMQAPVRKCHGSVAEGAGSRADSAWKRLLLTVHGSVREVSWKAPIRTVHGSFSC